MQKFLIKRFVKNHEDIRSVKVREQYGKLTSIIGVCINLLLFATKFIVGTIFGSVSITGDAVNNLSDAGSSVISFISFRMSGKPADHKHPFGHARIEYIASSVVAVVILLIGVELFQKSIDKIQNPSDIHFSLITTVVLLLSIALKFWLYRFNMNLSKRIDSSVMQATATDSISDVLTTSTVLISTILSPLIGFQLDGYMGIGVTIFIMVSGFRILKKTMDHVLGKGPSAELIELIDTYIRKHIGVIGIHDLVVHDYGPNRNFASAHVEVDAKVDIMESHDMIDNIEREIELEYGIHLVVHLDPVIRDDPYVDDLRQFTEQVIASVDDTMSLHDFRIVRGQTHSNLIFDITVPFLCRMTDGLIIEEVQNKIKREDKKLHAVITIDRA